MKFKKTISYIFRSTILSTWTYIFVIFIPLFFITSLYFLFLKNLINNENVQKSVTFSTLPLIFMTFFSAHFIITWRETVFLRQLNNFGITKICFFLSFLLIFFIYSILSYTISNSFLLLIDATFSFGNYSKLIFEFKSIGGFIIFLFSIFLMILLYFSISLLIAGKITNVYLSNSLILIFIIYILIFSDFFLETILYDNVFCSSLSFTSPQKYLNWIFYLSFSDAFLDKTMIYLFINKINTVVYFENITIPIISSFLFIIPLSSISFMLFSNSLK